MANFYRDLTDILRANGWELHRQGRGDHEIWRSSATAKSVTVDRSIKSRHTANAVLKQAGLPKSF
jgi:predicted RNA binding protein YcfA (HicA-like mRNA interferase family)